MTELSFMPMLCTTIDVVPEDSSQFVAEIKWDGWRAIATLDQKSQLVTRSLKPIVSVDYILEELQEIFPSDTILDGEIVDGETVVHSWNRVQTICSTQNPHVPNKDNPKLHYMVFDILCYRGEDVRNLPLVERLQIIENHIAKAQSTTIFGNRTFVPSQEKFDQLIGQGHEGIVIKRKNSPYVGGRSGGWSKLKPESDKSEEAIITALVKDGKGKYENMVGAIEFRLQDGNTGRCSGFSDPIRKQLTDCPEDYIGKVVEVGYWGKSPEGVLRHPQFRRLRDDRSPDEFKPKAKKPRQAKAKSSKPKMRNYKAMKQEKLLACMKSLVEQKGDAYDRCVNGGSGKPEEDLQVVKELLAQK